MSSHYTTPEPGDGPAYSEPLEKWIGTPVRAEWAGKEIKAVVKDVELGTSRLCFSGELILKRRDSDVTIRVAPENVTPR